MVSSITPETNLGFGMEEEVGRILEHSGKKVPYTLFANVDNEITVAVKKVKPADISINVQGGKSTKGSDGKFIVRVSKPGSVTIEIVNNKKED